MSDLRAQSAPSSTVRLSLGEPYFMRRIALLGLALTLSGCGYATWWNPPFSVGSNPNLPVGDSENMRRVMGNAAPTEPLLTEPGDIWPGQLQPAPTLQDLETKGGLTPQPEAPDPGSPLSRGIAPPSSRAEAEPGKFDSTGQRHAQAHLTANCAAAIQLRHAADCRFAERNQRQSRPDPWRTLRRYRWRSRIPDDANAWGRAVDCSSERQRDQYGYPRRRPYRDDPDTQVNSSLVRRGWAA